MIPKHQVSGSPDKTNRQRFGGGICPVPSALIFQAHTSTCNLRGLEPLGTANSTAIPGGLPPSGKTRSLKPSRSKSSFCISGSLLSLQTTSYTHNLRVLLTSSTASTRDNQMAKGYHKNTINKSQCNMTQSKPRSQNTAIPIYPDIPDRKSVV